MPAGGSGSGPRNFRRGRPSQEPMPYRDDDDAVQLRRQALRQELETLRAKREELEAATRRQKAIEGELVELEARARNAARRSLPLLDAARIASPCAASWADMTGTEQVRFCGSCEKNVYDISKMTRDAAEELLREATGGVCIRLYRRADGTVITADCPVGVRRKRVRRLAYGVVGGGLLAAGGLASAASVTMGDVGPPEAMMGQLSVVDEPRVDEAVEIRMGEAPAMHADPPPQSPAPVAPPRAVRNAPR